MKVRLIKKKSHQVIGTCFRCGAPVLNFVSNNIYKGSCIECDEDMYSFEICDYKRRGTPLNLQYVNISKYRYLPNW